MLPLSSPLQNLDITVYITHLILYSISYCITIILIKTILSQHLNIIRLKHLLSLTETTPELAASVGIRRLIRSARSYYGVDYDNYYTDSDSLIGTGTHSDSDSDSRESRSRGYMYRGQSEWGGIGMNNHPVISRKRHNRDVTGFADTVTSWLLHASPRDRYSYISLLLFADDFPVLVALGAFGSSELTAIKFGSSSSKGQGREHLAVLGKTIIEGAYNKLLSMPIEQIASASPMTGSGLSMTPSQLVADMAVSTFRVSQQRARVDQGLKLFSSLLRNMHDGQPQLRVASLSPDGLKLLVDGVYNIAQQRFKANNRNNSKKENELQLSKLSKLSSAPNKGDTDNSDNNDNSKNVINSISSNSSGGQKDADKDKDIEKEKEKGKERKAHANMMKELRFLWNMLCIDQNALNTISTISSSYISTGVQGTYARHEGGSIILFLLLAHA